MQNKFENFMLHSWIDYTKFRGASMFCAILLNIIWGIFKFSVCIAMLLVLWPHVGVGFFRSKEELSIFQKILLIICILLCIPVDLFVFLLFLLLLSASLSLLFVWSISSFIAALMLGFASYGLLRLLILLFRSLIGTKPQKTDFRYCSEGNMTYMERDVDDDSTNEEPHPSVDSVDYLWKSGSEADWHNALEGYYSKLSSNTYILDSYLESVSASDIQRLSVREFYDFLHDKYFVWKYTGSYLPSKQQHLQKYINEDKLHELGEIQNELFSCNRGDIETCLRIASKVKGMGVAGASGLLSILFPEEFGTVDKYLILALSKISNWSHEKELEQINPSASISVKTGALLIRILREKALELNNSFNTDFWTPRKIDMILWSIGR